MAEVTTLWSCIGGPERGTEKWLWHYKACTWLVSEPNLNHQGVKTAKAISNSNY